jgi:WD40 repeat protein
MTMYRTTLTATILLASFGFISAGAQADDQKPADKDKKEEPKVTFQDHILPIFRAKCGSCHNANDRKGNLVLDDYAAMREGGGSGAVVEPGDPDSSYLWMLVTHDTSPEMPPNGAKLPDNELNLIRQWIEQGLLQDKGSKAEVKKESTIAKIDVSGERPEGPPPMPKQFLGDPLVSTEHANTVTALAVSPWAPVAAVSGHKQVTLFDTRDRRLLGVLPFPEGQPEILRFSRNGSLLMVGGGRGGAAGKVIVFDVATGERQIEVGNEYDTVLGADISPDHTLVALGGPKRMVRVYSTATGELLYEKKKHTDWVTTAAFSPDGVLLATGDRANGLVLWEAQTGNEYLVLTGHTGSVTDLDWRPDSNSLASASLDGTVRLWELNDGKEIKRWNAHGGGVTAIDYVRDGRIVTTGKDRAAKLWQGDGSEIKAFGGLNEMGLEVAYDADNDVVLAGDWTGRVLAWKGEDGAALGEFSTNPPTLAEQTKTIRDQLTAAQAKAGESSQQVAAAQQQADNLLADRKAAADNAAAAAAQMVTQVEQATAEKAAAEQQVKDLEAKAKAAAEAQTQAQQAVTAAQQAQQKATAEKEAADAATAAAQAAVEAAGKIENSEQKKAVSEKAAQLLAEAQKVVQAAATSLEQANAGLAAATKAHQEATAARTQADKAVGEAQTAAKKSAETLAELQPKVKPLQEAAEKAKAAVVLSDDEKKPLAEAQAAHQADQTAAESLQKRLQELEAWTATASTN